MYDTTIDQRLNEYNAIKNANYPELPVFSGKSYHGMSGSAVITHLDDTLYIIGIQQGGHKQQVYLWFTPISRLHNDISCLLNLYSKKKKGILLLFLFLLLLTQTFSANPHP